MSTSEWLSEKPDSGGAKVPYLLVPRLQLTGARFLDRLSLAGWADKSGSAYVCKTCKKQLHLTLTELRVFPLAKPDTDIFQFSFSVPLHRTGGAFSTEVCKESGSTVLRDSEQPTVMRFLEREQVPTGGESERTEPKPAGPAEDEPVDKQEIKKKVESLSHETAEERYNYLQGRPITDLTDAEYEERLALVDRLAKDEAEE